MAVAVLGKHFLVTGSATSEFFYTQPAPMALTNSIHVAATCFGFSGSGTIEMWIQGSDDLEVWGFIGGSGIPLSLLQFTAIDAKQATVSPTATSPYNTVVGALWVRLALRVTQGTSIGGAFSLRTNSFLG